MDRKTLLFPTFVGSLAGVADLIPGISGGTVYYFSGLYEKMLSSFSLIGKLCLSPISTCTSQRSELFSSFVFLFRIGIGVLVSLSLCASLISTLLQSDVYRPYLFALFFGSILGALSLLIKEVSSWRTSQACYLIAGILLGVAALGSFGSFSFASFLESHASGPIRALVYFFSGALATCAMILPGISGSYILLILGMYGPLLSSWVVFVQSLLQGAFPIDVIWLLAPFCLGAFFGLLMSSHIISVCLRRFASQAHSFLIGCIVGSMWIVFPIQGQVLPSLFSLNTSVLLLVMVFSYVLSRKLRQFMLAISSSSIIQPLA